jgi:hypothetical protein
MFDPIGIDRWPFELALKYRMRGGYVCPIGGRWAVGFCSPGVLSNSFTQQDRGLPSTDNAFALVMPEVSPADLPRRPGGDEGCLRGVARSVRARGDWTTDAHFVR